MGDYRPDFIISRLSVCVVLRAVQIDQRLLVGRGCFSEMLVGILMSVEIGARVLRLTH